MTEQPRTELPKELIFASLAAENTTEFYRRLVAYLSRCVSRPIRLLEDVPWPERERRLRRGTAHLGLVCGLQYVAAQQCSAEPGLELLAAAVMSGERYQSRPVYFSDVIVRADHPARSLDDLRASRWAYNEPTSHSGYNITRYTLARLGYQAGFFGQIVETGSHQRSLQMVLDAAVDATTIDSTVFEQELRTHPTLAAEIRVVATFEASPVPPLVVSATLPRALRAELRHALVRMHRDTSAAQPAAREVLAAGAMQRYVRVTDADYALIRFMARIADEVAL